MFSIIPRDTGFFDLMERSAAVVVRAAQAYAALTHHYERRDQYVAEIRQAERDGDQVTHDTLIKLDTTFITPFDREDIHNLMKMMDDVIDEIDAASKRLTLYQIPAASDWLVRQTDVLLESSKLVADAVRTLRDIKHINGLQQTLVRIHELENIGDETNHAAVAALLNNSTDAIFAIKWKEIHDLTERAIDRCEDIADTIQAIVLKNT
ncbi:MAG: DUF47 family protein [Phycisphaerae bacterium]|nr:DUF47 family protein [Phycisphaerae bacterium]NUQ46027.1 DUF47 family protein [Phycisphaerae bacterium]